MVPKAYESNCESGIDTIYSIPGRPADAGRPEGAASSVPPRVRSSEPTVPTVDGLEVDAMGWFVAGPRSSIGSGWIIEPADRMRPHQV